MNTNAPASDAENINRAINIANANRPKRYNTRAASRRALADVSNSTTSTSLRCAATKANPLDDAVRAASSADASKKPRLNEDVVARRTRSSNHRHADPNNANTITTTDDDIDIDIDIDVDIDTDIELLDRRRTTQMLPPPTESTATAITEHELSDPVLAEAYACSLNLPVDVVDIDSVDVLTSNHLCESALAITIHRAQLSREVAGMSHHDYLAQRQRDVTARMRTILVDWLVDVHTQFRLSQNALYLAVNTFDRFLSTEDTVVARSQLQLVGVTCMWIAAKYEEIYPPCLEDFVYISDCTYTREELLRMEALICNKLNFVFTVPTVLPFVDRGLKALHTAHPNADSRISQFANYASELALCEYSMLKYRPSMLAAAAIALAAHTLAYCQLSWDNTMRFHTGGYTVEILNNCARDLWKIIQRDCSQSNSKICAVRRKYSSDKFNRVALVAATLKFEHTNNTSHIETDNYNHHHM